MGVKIWQLYHVVSLILVFSHCSSTALQILNKSCQDNNDCKTESDAWSCRYEVDPKSDEPLRACRSNDNFMTGDIASAVYPLDVIEKSYYENEQVGCSLRVAVAFAIPDSELKGVNNATFQLRYTDQGTGGEDAIECITITVTRVKKSIDRNLTVVLECTQNMSGRSLDIQLVGRSRDQSKKSYWMTPETYYSFSKIITYEDRTCCMENSDSYCSVNAPSRSYWPPNMQTIVMVAVGSLSGIVVVVAIVILAKHCSHNKKESCEHLSVQPNQDRVRDYVLGCHETVSEVSTCLLPEPEPFQADIHGCLNIPAGDEDSIFDDSASATLPAWQQAIRHNV